jgi:hypothetical protein
MGTGFDCFDEMSHTASSEITAEQRENRRLLVDAMWREVLKTTFVNGGTSLMSGCPIYQKHRIS